LHWVGSAKRDFLAFPDPVKSDMGYALGLAQLGGKHSRAKPWKGEGPGVFEIVENHDGDTYRALYTVRFGVWFMSCMLSRRRARRASAPPTLILL
jgi:phage-related protein